MPVEVAVYLTELKPSQFLEKPLLKKYRVFESPVYKTYNKFSTCRHPIPECTLDIQS